MDFQIGFTALIGPYINSTFPWFRYIVSEVWNRWEPAVWSLYNLVQDLIITPSIWPNIEKLFIIAQIVFTLDYRPLVKMSRVPSSVAVKPTDERPSSSR